MKKGDTLATRCTMENFRSSTVSVGPTNDDEMCNFYLMYWVEGTEIMKQTTCFSHGPPVYQEQQTLICKWFIKKLFNFIIQFMTLYSAYLGV